MSLKKLTSVLATLFLVIGLSANAANTMPSNFTYQGRLMNAAGTAALTGSLTLYLEIYNPAKSCLLYSEHQAITTSDGIFSIQIGSGTRTASTPPYTDDPGNNFVQIFKNTDPFCGGSWVPATADGRVLVVHVYDGTTTTTLADQQLTPVPQALVADTLAGVSINGFVQSWTTATRPDYHVANITIGWNHDLKKLEMWNGAAWVPQTPKFSASASGDATTDKYVMKWNAASKEWEPADIATLLPNLGGDVTGAPSANTISSLQGRALDLSTAPNPGQVLKWDGTKWVAANESAVIIGGSGTNNVLSKFDGTGGLKDSRVSDDGTLVTINSDTNINGDITLPATQDKKIINLATPTGSFDAANKKYVDDKISNTFPISASDGQMMVWQGGAGGSWNLTDVTGLVSNKFLKWDGSNWVPATLSTSDIGGPYVKTDGSTPLTNDWAVGNHDITGIKNLSATNVSAGTTTTNVLNLAEQATAPTNTAGYGKIYVATDNSVHYLDEAGSDQTFVFGAGAGETNDGQNVGGGTELYKGKSGVHLQFRTLTTPDSTISATQNGDNVELKIAQDGATPNQLLKWNGTKWEPATLTSSDIGGPYVKTDGSTPLTGNWNTGNYNITNIKDLSATGSTTLSGDLTLSTGATVNEFSTDGTLTGNSDIAIPTEQAVKTYVDALNTSLPDIETGTATGQLLRWNGTKWDKYSLGDAKILVGNGADNSAAVSVSGDATLSNAGAIKVTQIQGNPVDSTVLGAGDAAKVLKWDGSKWVADTDAGGTTISGGTVNVLSKFNAGGNNVINSSITDDGSKVTTLNQVGIGTTTPDASAILDLTSANSGLLLPRLPRASIASPVKGLTIYDTGDDAIYYYDGGWKALGVSGAGITGVAAGNGMTVTGGTGPTATVTVNYDDSTIGIIGGKLAVKDSGITDVKINDVGVNKITSGAGKYLTYEPNGTACASNELLKWNGTNWICAGVTTADLQSNTLNEGKIWVGNGSNKAAETTLTSGQILVGNATSKATPVSVSGDATLSNAGALTVTKIQGNPVDSTVLSVGDATKVLKWDGSKWIADTDAGGTTISGGTVNVLSKFNAGGNNVINSSITDDGSKVTTLSQVGIGTATPDASAILDLNSTTQGALLPRMTTAQRGAISSPADGLTVYDTDTHSIYYYNSNASAWQALGVSGSGLTSLNGLTNGSQSFAIGTSGNSPAWSSSGSTHTLNIPMASSGASVTAGLISNAELTALQSNTLNEGKIWVGDGSNKAAETTLTSGQILVGNATSKATPVSVSGDATLSDAGAIKVTAIQNRAIDTTAPTDGQILTWDNASSKWKPANAPTSIANGTSTNNTLRWDGSNWVETNELTVSGSGTAVTVNAPLSMTSKKIVNLADPTLAQDAATKNYVDSKTSSIPSIEAGTANGQLLKWNSTSSKWEHFTLTDSNILVGNASDEATPVSVSGDATLSNAGAIKVTQIQGNPVDSTVLGVGDATKVLKWDGSKWIADTDAGGTTISGGTVNVLSKFNAGGNNVINSSITDDGSKVTTLSQVGIGTATPDASAILDLNSTTQGALLPRMTTAQRDAISSPANGLTVYNTSTNSIDYYNSGSSSWATLGVSGSGLTSLNGLTNSSQSFAIGTSGNSPAWNSSGSTHTLNIPMADAGASVTAGLISNTQYERIPASGTATNNTLRWDGTHWVETSTLTVSAGGSPTVTINAPLDMNTHKITNVVDPTANQDAATKHYVDNATSGAIISGANVGTGIGVYKDKTGTTLNFKSIQSPNSTILVTADGGGNMVNLDIHQGGATNGQVLKWNGTKWAPAYNSYLVASDGSPDPALSVDATGLITSTSVQDTISAGTDLVNKNYLDARIGANASLDAGTADDQILRWNNTSKKWEPLTAGKDVSATKNATSMDFTVTGLQGKTIDTTLPSANGQVYFWDNTDSKWKVSNSVAPTDGQVLSWDTSLNSGHGAWKAGTVSGTISGLTTNKIPKAASATSLADSSITDDGTTVSTSSLVSITPNSASTALAVTQSGAGYAATFMGGNVGIGTTTPTAKLHLPAGTATAGTAPLKLTSGPLNTTPEAGAIEFLTNDLYYTGTDGTRRTIATAGGAGSSVNGTTNYIAKFTPDGSHVGNSSIQDDGTKVTFSTYPDITTSQIYFDGERILHQAGSNTNLFAGIGSGSQITTGTSNVGIGHNSMLYSVSGSFNTAFGASALVFEETGSQNTAIGSGALNETYGASYNTAVGVWSLGAMDGSHNTALGWNSGANLTGASNNNVLLGSQSGPPSSSTISNKLYINNTASNSPLIYGDFTDKYAAIHNVLRLPNMTTPPTTAASGYGQIYVKDSDKQLYFRDHNNVEKLLSGVAGGSTPVTGTGTTNVMTKWSNTTGGLTDSSVTDNGTKVTFSTYPDITTSQIYFDGERILHQAGSNTNLFAGIGSGSQITTGTSNVGIGHNSMLYSVSGSFNTALGANTLLANTTGSENTASGTNALQNNTTGSENTASGSSALSSNKGKQGSTAIGSQSMYYANDSTSGGYTNNTAVGYQSLRGSTTASANTGTNNTALGANTLLANTTGSSNTASGTNALQNNTTGSSNTASGRSALVGITTGSNNTASGYQALYNVTTGGNNTAIGYQAGLNLATTSSGNVIIGYQAGPAMSNIFTNKLYINNAASANPLIYGEFGAAGFVTINGTGGVTAAAYYYSSDKRLKENITPLESPLAQILKLKPVEFDWKDSHKHELGLIAQEVQEVYPDLVKENPNTGYLSVQYGNLVSPLIGAVQELNNKCEMSSQQIADLDSRLKTVERKIASIEQKDADQDFKIKALEKQNAELKKQIDDLKRLIQKQH